MDGRERPVPLLLLGDWDCELADFMDGLLNGGAEAFLYGLPAPLCWRLPLKSQTGLVLFRVASITSDLFSLYFHGEVLKDV